MREPGLEPGSERLCARILIICAWQRPILTTELFTPIRISISLGLKDFS